MNAVLGYTALLADEIYGPISALQKEHIGRVQSSGSHLLGLDRRFAWLRAHRSG